MQRWLLRGSFPNHRDVRNQPQAADEVSPGALAGDRAGAARTLSQPGVLRTIRAGPPTPSATRSRAWRSALELTRSDCCLPRSRTPRTAMTPSISCQQHSTTRSPCCARAGSGHEFSGSLLPGPGDGLVNCLSLQAGPGLPFRQQGTMRAWTQRRAVAAVPGHPGLCCCRGDCGPDGGGGARHGGRVGGGLWRGVHLRG
jgi:hypothetical protein